MGRDFAQDIAFGIRSLGRRPAFAAAVVLILGIGIGAPTTVFTLVSTIFFDRPAEVAEPHRLLRVYRSWAPGEGGGSLSNPDYVYYRQNASTLAGLAAYSPSPIIASYMTGGPDVDQLRVWPISDNYFDVLGVAPALGRTFRSEENVTAGGHPVAVLAYGFWRRAFGLDPDVVGRTLILNGTPFSVVGVAPEDFRGLSPIEGSPDAFVPIAMTGVLTGKTDIAWWERMPDSRENWLSVVGRLAPGVTFEAAEANLSALSAALEYEGRGAAEGVMALRQFLYRPSQATKLAGLSRMLIAVVMIVLAIAAANVAVLLLFRATGRTREMGIRTAIGASRGRLIRQLLTESLILGLAGGALGLGIAFAASGIAASLLPMDLSGSFRPDLRVLLAATGLSVVTALAVGIVPSVHVARADIAAQIHDSSMRAGRSRAQGALVVGQVGLSLILVAGAVLFAESFWAARTQELGFEAENRLIVQVNLGSHGYDAERGLPFLSQAIERLAAVPGVEGVTLTSQVPFQGEWTSSFDAPPGAMANEADNQITTGMNLVGPDYFRISGIPVLLGRALGREDVQGTAPVIVINETLAERIWPGLNPLGRMLPMRRDIDFEVVGVIGTAAYYELGEEPYPQAFGAALQGFSSRMHFLVETGVPPADLAPAVQDALREIDPTLAFGWVTTMESVIEDEVARYKVSAVLVGVFALLALTLAAGGLYAVVSYLVAQRTREIGVRMALGADRGRVAREVVRSGLRLTVVGMGLGLAGVVVLRRLTESLLYQIEPGDPWPLLVACVALLIVASLASLLPAVQATRVDPMESIRTD